MQKKTILVLENRSIYNTYSTYGQPFIEFCNVTTDADKLLNKKIDCVLFTGGEDVSPVFYNGKNCGASYTNLKRDLYEKDIFNYCLSKKIKMTGICRGSQFLNVMVGGRMYQDIHGHSGLHPAYFSFLDEIVDVTSTHHQLVQIPKDAIPIIWAIPKRSTGYYLNPDGEIDEEVEKEVESTVYPEHNIVAVQFHPEFVSNKDPLGKIYGSMMRDFIYNSMDSFVSDYVKGEHYGRRKSA